MSAMMEIERKFLVTGEGWRHPENAKKISQGYISKDDECVVRVRQKGEKFFLTIKANRGEISRLEFEYEIPKKDCELMLEQLCANKIAKTRHKVKVGGKVWEIDEFHGENEGLIMAEIELGHADEVFEKPDWAGPEVSHDARFFNSYISEHPFSSWGVSYADLIAQMDKA